MTFTLLVSLLEMAQANLLTNSGDEMKGFVAGEKADVDLRLSNDSNEERNDSVHFIDGGMGDESNSPLLFGKLTLCYI